MSGKSKNLDVYLEEVFKQYVALKDNDLKKSQEVFKSVFEQVKQKMGEQCNYFSQYASQVMYAGSVYDGIKVSKLDEFDMDIVIRLPINQEEGENGIVLENDEPGFVKMKITKQFDNLDKQKDWETKHKVTRDWRDTDKYFLQNKFRNWMHSIVQKALNEMDGKVDVNGVVYDLKYRTAGPAYTLNVRGSGVDDYTLDVDLVPVIRFKAPGKDGKGQWPKGYRCIEGSQIGYWLAVPKPNKNAQDEKSRNRCWRLSFQDYEKEMMKGCQQLKKTIRLVKKLRDALEMKVIASYYIKTLFLWKIDKSDKKYWETKISATFRSMVEELYNAIVAKHIPYFWNESNNLIATLKPTIQKLYGDKLKAVLNSIDANDVDKVVACLLTKEELKQFQQSDFYQAQVTSNCTTPSNSSNSNLSRQESVASNVLVETAVDNQILSNLVELMKILSKKMDALTDKVSVLDDRLSCVEMEKKAEKILSKKVDALTDKASGLDDRLNCLEMAKKAEKTRTAADDLSGLSFGVTSLCLLGQPQSENETLVDNAAILASKSDTTDLLTF